MNARRCSTPLFAWREAITDPVVGPQPLPVYGGGAQVSRRAQVSVALAGLMPYMNSDGGSCWPSVETLAQATGLGERTVQYALSALIAQGFVEVVRRGGRGRANSYEARLPPRARDALRQGAEQLTLADEARQAGKGAGPAPFRVGPETVQPAPERVRDRPGKGAGPAPEEVHDVREEATRAGAREADVVSLDAFRARRAESRDPAPWSRIPGAEPRATADPEVWSKVWWWARSRGDTRLFPQLADQPGPGEPISDAEYLRLEAEWRAAGSPYVFDPRLVTGVGLDLSCSREGQADGGSET